MLTPIAATSPIAHSAPASAIPDPLRRRGPRLASASREQHRGGRPQRDHVSRDQIIRSTCDQYEVDHQAGQCDHARDQGAAARHRVAAERQQGQRRNRQQLSDSFEQHAGRRAETDQELRHDLTQPREQRDLRDPARMPAGVLLEGERNQRQPARASDGDGDPNPAAARIDHQQPDRLRGDDKQGVVVRGQG